MTCRNAGPHGEFAQREIPDPVHASDTFDRKAVACFFDDAPSLGLRQFDVGLVGETVYRATLVVVANAALETDHRSYAGGLQLALQARHIDG